MCICYLIGFAECMLYYKSKLLKECCPNSVPMRKLILTVVMFQRSMIIVLKKKSLYESDNL